MALGLGAPAAVGDAEPAATAEASAEAEPEFWFPVGEELIYRIYWGAIPVGESRATTEWIEEDGRRLIRIQFRTRTNRVLSTLYPVDDLIESVIDPEPFLPLRFTKNLKEGRHRYHETTTFDWEQMEARWVCHLKKREKTFPLEPDTRDIPSLMYWLRRTGIAAGEELKLRVMADEKIYDLEVATEGVERIRIERYGRIPSLKLEPKAAFGGVFVRKGRMWMWVSQDPRYVSTQISVEVPIARVHLVLREVRGPGDDFWVRRR